MFRSRLFQAPAAIILLLYRMEPMMGGAKKPSLRGKHGSLNVPIEHHPTMKGIWSTRWLLFQVMSNIPKMGQLPTPGKSH